MAPRRWRNIIFGYIEQKKDSGGDVEKDSEEDEEPEFLDMTEMTTLTSGGEMIKASSLATRQVNFYNRRSRSKVEVMGRFVLTDPWWEVTCRVRRITGRLVVQGYPEYGLRADLTGQVKVPPMVSLFLTACGAQPTHVTMFNEWLLKDGVMRFSSLLENLARFEQAEEEYTAVGLELKSLATVSVAGRRMQAALQHPQVMRYLPTLLPRQFAGLLEIREQRERGRSTQNPQEEAQMEEMVLLDKLEEIIKTNVWKLGFKDIVRKETHLLRCEATLEAFQQCGLFQRMPKLQQNALLVYKKLKDHCQRDNTYIEPNFLNEFMGKKKVSKEDTEKAVGFLEEHGVVVYEEQELVALRNLYEYETDIAKCLDHLLTAEPWHIEVDMRGVLQVPDPDQMRAAKMICTNPVTVISGKGGCGKTTVVSRLFWATRQQKSCDWEEVQNACRDFENDRGGSQGWDFPVDQIDHAPQEESSSSNGTQQQLSECEEVQNASRDFENDHGRSQGWDIPVDQHGHAPQQESSMSNGTQHQLCEWEEVQNASRDFENDHGGPQGWDVPVDQHDHAPQQESSSNGTPPQAEERIEILLTAPTGRAAALLSKKTGIPAFTLHQVWWSFMNAKKEKGLTLWKFSSVSVLVVDEGSLVGVQILSSILSVLTKHAQLKKFVFLGDLRQLPSIAPGNTLCDLFNSLQSIGSAIEMKTNHRAESQLIIKNAGLISEMSTRMFFKPLEYDATVNMLSPVMPTPDKKFIHVVLPPEKETADYYVLICGNLVLRSQQPCDLPGGIYIHLNEAINLLLKSAPGLEDDKSSQFIAFRKKECELINELCCKHYSDHNTRDDKKKFKFQPKDKICCMRNGYVTDREKEKELERECRNDNEKKKVIKERLCNGQIFFITEDVDEELVGRDKKRYLTLDDHQGKKITVLFKELQSECKLQHAWARTIHTYQGSEAETVVYVLGRGHGQTWQHVYTAVTRGQKRVYVVATETAMRTAIMKPVKKRNTRLRRLMSEWILAPGEEPPSPPGNTEYTPRAQATSPGLTQSSQTSGPTDVERDLDDDGVDIPNVLLKTEGGPESSAGSKRAGTTDDCGGPPCKQPRANPDEPEP